MATLPRAGTPGYTHEPLGAIPALSVAGKSLEVCDSAHLFSGAFRAITHVHPLHRGDPHFSVILYLAHFGSHPSVYGGDSLRGTAVSGCEVRLQDSVVSDWAVSDSDLGYCQLFPPDSAPGFETHLE